MDRDQKLFFFFNIYCSHESSQKQDFFFYLQPAGKECKFEFSKPGVAVHNKVPLYECSQYYHLIILLKHC